MNILKKLVILGIVLTSVLFVSEGTMGATPKNNEVVLISCSSGLGDERATPLVLSVGMSTASPTVQLVLSHSFNVG